MKNQYFGDINDYHKYALLRALLKGGKIKLLVAWMLTNDDNGPDGNKRRFLKNVKKKWRELDPDLFDFLLALHDSRSEPNVSLIEKTRKILPNTSFYSKNVEDGIDARVDWQKGLMKAAFGTDLVFLDPDNGFEVKSKGIGNKGSSKYVYWEEIQPLFWDAGKSLLIYQHGRRVNYEKTVKETFSELYKLTNSPLIMCFCSGQVLFFLVTQTRHYARFRMRISLFIRKWEGKIWENKRTSPKPLKGRPKPYTPHWDPDDGIYRGVLEGGWLRKVKAL